MGKSITGTALYLIVAGDHCIGAVCLWMAVDERKIPVVESAQRSSLEM